MIKRLCEKIDEKGSPIVVGLDPSLKFIPKNILTKCFAEYGETLEGAAEAFGRFNRVIIDSVCDLVPAVKPQIAMYEQLGIPGLIAFQKTVDYAHEKGLVVIGDIKRGDIGNTARFYAESHIGSVSVGSENYSPFDEDFATVNPYLGTDSVQPFIDVCKENGKGIFVLVKTSNKSSGDFQDKLIDGKPLYYHVASKVNEWGKQCIDGVYSDVGAVVGATYPEVGRELRKVMPNAFILVPGYGAQGGKGEDLVPFFNNDGKGAIINSSRGIIAAYKREGYEKFSEENFGDAARAAVLEMKIDIDNALDKALN
ncbi:MAG: orotidine-5'-phosphate decarboxylase [Lachnospiraceae bacterium]|nr:orotidine-5'-phosphate decarboxylase [Lachnospiraceae bacterium]